MINFNLHISNPWSNKFDTVFSKHGKISKHKAWELEAYKSNSIIGVTCNITSYTDHAGLALGVSLFYYSLFFTIYDTRHFNYETGKYES